MAPNAERHDLIDSLDRHRGFLLQTADGLSEAQARTASTVSALTIASILKHVADTEEEWMQFALRGAEAFGSVYEQDVDWEAVDAAAAQGEDWGEWEDTRFEVGEAETMPVLRERVLAVGRETSRILEEGTSTRLTRCRRPHGSRRGRRGRCAGWRCTCSRRSPSTPGTPTSSGKRSTGSAPWGEGSGTAWLMSTGRVAGHAVAAGRGGRLRGGIVRGAR